MSDNEGNHNEQPSNAPKPYQFGDITKSIYKSITKKRVKKGVKSTINREANPNNNDQPGALHKQGDNLIHLPIHHTSLNIIPTISTTCNIKK